MKTKVISIVTAFILTAFLAGLWTYIFTAEVNQTAVLIVAILSLLLLFIIGFLIFIAIKSVKEKKEEPVYGNEPEQETPCKPEMKIKQDSRDVTMLMFDEAQTALLYDDADETEIVNSRRFRIKLADKANPIKSYETYLTDEVVIGRAVGQCSIVIDGEPSISRRHCRLFISDDGSVMVEDLGAANKTYVNGQQLTNSSIEIASGDELKMGRSVFTITVE